MIVFVICTLVSAWATPVETTIYSFGSSGDGANPGVGLVFDTSGNLYGVTSGGGTSLDGAVFELSHTSQGWTERVIYSFCPDGICSDGSDPLSTLVMDSAGNLYGMTAAGGNGGCNFVGCGVVFELSPSASGWTESVLYTFTGGSDGGRPLGGVAFDNVGNLYGTATSGGTGNCMAMLQGCGVIFELVRQNGIWSEKVLHRFLGGNDGDIPSAAVILDTAGNIYGTTAGGGPNDPGTVFELTHTATGWKETILYRFTGKDDGSSPVAALLFDKLGNVYGTTRYGGGGRCAELGYTGCGVVFKISRSSGHFIETVLHAFTGGSSDGAVPVGNLIFDGAGRLNGTTEEGGKIGNCGSNGCGTVFRLTPGAGGTWKQTILHRFGAAVGDGAYPEAGLTSDAMGDLYGTTELGGIDGDGSAFQITP